MLCMLIPKGNSSTCFHLCTSHKRRLNFTIVATSFCDSSGHNNRSIGYCVMYDLQDPVVGRCHNRSVSSLVCTLYTWPQAQVPMFFGSLGVANSAFDTNAPEWPLPRNEHVLHHLLQSRQLTRLAIECYWEFSSQVIALIILVGDQRGQRCPQLTQRMLRLSGQHQAVKLCSNITLKIIYIYIYIFKLYILKY